MLRPAGLLIGPALIGAITAACAPMDRQASAAETVTMVPTITSFMAVPAD